MLPEVSEAAAWTWSLVDGFMRSLLSAATKSRGSHDSDAVAL
jgi:hypothetical protein